MKWWSRIAQLERAQKLLEFSLRAKTTDDPFFSSLFPLTLSPVGNGKYASRIHEVLWQKTAEHALLSQLAALHYVPPMDFPPEQGVFFGVLNGTQIPVGIHRNALTGHVLITGATSAGKSQLLYVLIHFLRGMRIPVHYEDHRLEGRRLLNRYSDVMVLNPKNEPWNALEFVGDRRAYWSGLFEAFATPYNLRPETYPMLLALMERIFQGIKDDPLPSWEDFRRVVEAEAAHQKRENLYTAARAILNIVIALGKNARLRRGANIQGGYPITVFEYAGLDHLIYSALLGFRFIRLLMEASQRAHTSELQKAMVIDEGVMVFASELQATVEGHVSAARRFASMARFTGTALLTACQSVSSLDTAIKTNCNTFVCFRAPSVRDALECAQMLGLPHDSVSTLTSLPTGTALMRSVGWQQPVLINVPYLDMGPYPSDSDVLVKIKPELDWIERNNVYADLRDSGIDPIYYRSVVGEQPPAGGDQETAKGDAGAEDSRSCRHAQFFEDHYLFLQDVHKHPGDGLKRRYERLKFGIAKGNRVLGELKQAGCVVVDEVENSHGKTGRPRLVVSLTARGKQLLQSYEQGPRKRSAS